MLSKTLPSIESQDIDDTTKKNKSQLIMPSINVMNFTPAAAAATSAVVGAPVLASNTTRTVAILTQTRKRLEGGVLVPH